MSTRDGLSRLTEDFMPDTPQTPRVTGGARRHNKFRRRLADALTLSFSLVISGGLYTVLVPQSWLAPAAADTAPADHARINPAKVDQALLAKDQQLYDNACISCHGTNLEGVAERGPSLIGVGAAAVFSGVHRAHAAGPQADPRISQAPADGIRS